MSVVLVLAASSIFVLLGVAHAAFTWQSTPTAGPMMPTSPTVRAAMSEVGGLGMAPDIESSLYRAWIGFNLSHSLGVVAIGAIVFVHGAIDLGAAVDQPWFLAVVIAAPLMYFLLAVKYWFDKPRDAIAFATVLLWAGVVIELF